MIIEGERIRLRTATADDLPAFTHWFTDTEFRRLMGLGTGTLEALVLTQANQVNFAVETKDGQLIGYVFITQIRTINRHCELGEVAIGEPDARDKGYGTEMVQLALGFCFRELGMHQVHVRTAEFNERARHVYGKLFPNETRHREWVWADDRFWDEVYFDITEEEWAARNA